MDGKHVVLRQLYLHFGVLYWGIPVLGILLCCTREHYHKHLWHCVWAHRDRQTPLYIHIHIFQCNFTHAHVQKKCFHKKQPCSKHFTMNIKTKQNCSCLLTNAKNNTWWAWKNRHSSFVGALNPQFSFATGTRCTAHKSNQCNCRTRFLHTEAIVQLWCNLSAVQNEHCVTDRIAHRRSKYLLVTLCLQVLSWTTGK